MLSQTCKNIKPDKDCYSISDKNLEGGNMAEMVRIADYICETPHKTLVVKKYDNRINTDKGILQRHLWSLYTTRNMNHPNIAELCGYLSDDSAQTSGWDPSSIYAFFEYIAGNDLHKYMQKHRDKYNVIELNLITGYMACQILSGLDYIHTIARVVHFDLKPVNIVASSDLSQVKIIDFDLMLPIGSKNVLQGTTIYMPPEFPCDGTPGVAQYQADIWSFGCILYELWTGRGIMLDCHNLLSDDILSENYIFISPENSKRYLKGIVCQGEHILVPAKFIDGGVIDYLIGKNMANSVLKDVCKHAMQIAPENRSSAADLLRMAKYLISDYFNNLIFLAPNISEYIIGNVPDSVDNYLAEISEDAENPGYSKSQLLTKLIPTFRAKNPGDLFGSNMVISIDRDDRVENIVFDNKDNGKKSVWTLDGIKLSET